MNTPTVSASIDRFGRASATVTFPVDVTHAMHGRALDLAHAAIVDALMSHDGAHPRERIDYTLSVVVSMTDSAGGYAVAGNRVFVHAL